MNNFVTKEADQINKVRFLDLYMAGHSGFIAGGCFKNILNAERIKDLDVFFKSEEDFQQAVEYFKTNEDYVHSYENKNTSAFKNKKTNIRVELVRSIFGSVEDILSRFDFSITKFAYFKNVDISIQNNQLVEIRSYKIMHHVDFFEHLHLKKLVLEEQIFFPVSTWERSYRYRGYGYGLCKESKAHLLNALKVADVTDLSNELYFGLD